MLGTALVVALLVAACSSTDPRDTSIAGTTTQPSPTASEPTRDEITPLVVSSLGDPVPVRGSDDRYHLAYELQILNFAPRRAEIRSIEVLDDASGDVVASMDGEQIVEASIAVGDVPAQATQVSSLAPGGTVIVLMDPTFEERTDLPDRVIHRITADFAPPAAGQAAFASSLYPGSVSETTAAMKIGEGEPLVIGSPLQGQGWTAVNACCALTPHRGAMLPMNGRINGTERYAIDWVQIEPGRTAETLARGLLPSFSSDPTRNEDYLAYDEPLLAVGDATVTEVRDDADDAVPQSEPGRLPLEQLAGNSITLDLGNGFYAFYAHVKRGSFTVHEGDRVRKGDVIARLGSSGNSTEPHLHFHIMRGPTPLAATNWPFEIERFTMVGTLTENGIEPDPTPGPRTNALVLVRNVTDFTD